MKHGIRSTLSALAALSGVLGCTPNIVVGARDLDAAMPDAAEPTSRFDAGRDATTPPPPPDASTTPDAATPPPDPDASTRRDSGSGCSLDEHCTDPDEPLCKLSEGKCVECLSDDDCDPSDLCEDDGECSARPIPCTSAAQCEGSDDPICHPTLQICVECVTDADCPRDDTCKADNECD